MSELIASVLLGRLPSDAPAFTILNATILTCQDLQFNQDFAFYLLHFVRLATSKITGSGDSRAEGYRIHEPVACGA
jgi:hypothetical protein